MPSRRSSLITTGFWTFGTEIWASGDSEPSTLRQRYVTFQLPSQHNTTHATIRTPSHNPHPATRAGRLCSSSQDIPDFFSSMGPNILLNQSVSASESTQAGRDCQALPLPSRWSCTLSCSSFLLRQHPSNNESAVTLPSSCWPTALAKAAREAIVNRQTVNPSHNQPTHQPASQSTQPRQPHTKHNHNHPSIHSASPAPSVHRLFHRPGPISAFLHLRTCNRL